MIAVKIDVTLIDKTKLFPGKKANVLGKCPQYLDIVLFENKHGEDQYGNHYVVSQSLSKEDRAAGKKNPILGNAKLIETVGKPQPKPEIERMRENGQEVPKNDEDDDVPF